MIIPIESFADFQAKNPNGTFEEFSSQQVELRRKIAGVIGVDVEKLHGDGPMAAAAALEAAGVTLSRAASVPAEG